jgi:hypothetical protein
MNGDPIAAGERPICGASLRRGEAQYWLCGDVRRMGTADAGSRSDSITHT